MAATGTKGGRDTGSGETAACGKEDAERDEGAEGRKMAAKDGCHGNKGGTRRGRGGVVAMTWQHTERNGTGREGTGRDERGLLEADGGAVLKALVAGFDELVLAELLDGGEGRVLAGEDEVDGALACDVLDLTA